MSAEDDFRAFIVGMGGVSKMGHADKVRVFAWLQHHLRKKERFQTGDINWCYKTLNYHPSNTSQYLKDMEGKELLKDSRGYYFEGSHRETYDKLYGEHEISRNVRQALKDLENLLPDLGEKDIYQEAMKCLRHDCSRAAIVMVWNIAFYHLCQFILAHHKDDFNNRLPIRFQKKWKITDLPVITKYDDFAENMNERDVLENASSAGIITNDIYKVYVGALGKRNSAAHPSLGHISPAQAEGLIDELVHQAIVLLKI